MNDYTNNLHILFHLVSNLIKSVKGYPPPLPQITNGHVGLIFSKQNKC